jgi:DNA mismatch endonuclease (patch repair protein)
MERCLRATGGRVMSRRTPVDPIRSRVMAAIRSRNTRPEKFVRSIAHRMGYRFRLHRGDLPGSPEIVFPRLKAVILVHGCFWHRHQCAWGRKVPRSNAAYWARKFVRNKRRDARNQNDLKRVGWRVLVVWECQLGRPRELVSRLHRFLSIKEGTNHRGCQS